MNVREARYANTRMLIERCGGVSAFAEKIGKSQSQASQFAGENPIKGIGNKIASEIEAAFGLDHGWLDRVSDPFNVEPAPALRGKVPLISWVAAGDWCEANDPYSPGEAEMWLQVSANYGVRSYGLRVRGESMLPRFREGEIIIVDPDAQADSGNYVIARKDGSKEVTFKQLVIEGAAVYLKPLNPQWPDPIIRIDGDWHICGKVVCKMELF